MLATADHGGGPFGTTSGTTVREVFTLVGGALNGAATTVFISGGASSSGVTPSAPAGPRPPAQQRVDNPRSFAPEPAMTDAFSTPIPTHTVSRDLNDAEFAELDELLAATPEPLTPVDVVMLDGFLCGVLVQPVLLEPAVWLPHVFDFDGAPLPETVDAAWRERTTALVMRRHAALNRALTEDGWFDPLILEFDEDAEQDDPVARDLARERAGQPDPLEGMSEVSKPLMPWVAGFQLATSCFPDLTELPDDDVNMALSRLFRHLPAETDEERELVATLDRESPLATLDDAIDELVASVADLGDLTRGARYRVETVKRDAPKVGRNDPCPCGSGKKFKVCHGV